VPNGFDRRVSPASAGRWGMLDTVAVLEEQGPAMAEHGGARAALDAEAVRAGAPRITWTLRWFDPAEVQGRLRSWSGSAPQGVGWGATLRSVAALGDQALFTVRAGGRMLLLRVNANADLRPTSKPRGGIETAEVPLELLPGADVAFSAGRDGPIAWLRDTSLVVWVSGEVPRVIASLATRAVRTLGQPTTSGVPVLLSANDWALARTVPIPPRPRGTAQAAPAADVARLGLDGWAVVPNVRRELTRLPACSAHPRGNRFVFQRSVADAVVDGHRETAQGAVYDVRVTALEGNRHSPTSSTSVGTPHSRVLSGSDACIAAMAALLSPDRAAPGSGAPAEGPVAFARADFSARRAEGGERGVGARGSTRRLVCTLSPRGP
jgi:hypothetical protein